MLDIFIEKQIPWGDFGIDLALGTPADRKASSMDYMFLPYKMYQAFEHAVLTVDGREEPFVKKSHILYQELPEDPDKSWLTPVNIFFGLLLIIISITLFEIRSGKYYRSVDLFVTTVLSLAGTILFLLWFATDHIATKTNYNLLWASPIHLFSIYLLFNKKFWKFSTYYFLFWAIFPTLILIGWYYIPQQLHPGIIPLVLISVIRAYRIYVTRKNLSDNVERRK